VTVADLHLSQSETADGGDPLCVEKDEEAGDAISELRVVVAKQPSGLFPTGLGVDDAGGGHPADGRVLQNGQLL